MELCIMILKEYELFETLIGELKENNFKNITILESETLKTKADYEKESNQILSIIKNLLDSFIEESQIVLVPIESERINHIKKIVKEIVSPSRYLLFTFPIYNIEGNLK